MNTFLAAGLFENPWVVIAIIAVGSVANWLSKQREKKQAEKQRKIEETETSDKPSGEFDLEETIRRFMGGKPPAPSPEPPPMPRAVMEELPRSPEPDWQEEETFQPVREIAPPLRPPFIPVSPAYVTATVVSEQLEQAALRFEQLNEQGRRPATVVSHERGLRSHTGERAASHWRDPRTARRAFVASLVFGPPKGLEP